MTKPPQSDLDGIERASSDWSLPSLGSYILRKNGLFVTACLALIIFQTVERRERDTQVISILTTNAKILSDLNASVHENDTRDQKSLEEMRPCVNRIEYDLHELKNEISRLQK